MEPFKKQILKFLERECTGKSLAQQTDLIWDSRFIYTGFIYKGMEFSSPVSRGVPKRMPEAQAIALGVDAIYEHLNQWEGLKSTLITWLNATRTLAHAALWLPEYLVQEWGLTPHEPDKHTELLLSFKETDEYLVLESLIAYNNIMES